MFFSRLFLTTLLLNFIFFLNCLVLTTTVKVTHDILKLKFKFLFEALLCLSCVDSSLTQWGRKDYWLFCATSRSLILLLWLNDNNRHLCSCTFPLPSGTDFMWKHAFLIFVSRTVAEDLDGLLNKRMNGINRMCVCVCVSVWRLGEKKKRKAYVQCQG